jgi:hypothetical protein
MIMLVDHADLSEKDIELAVRYYAKTTAVRSLSAAPQTPPNPPPQIWRFACK